MGKFSNNSSIAEAMGDVSGKTAQFVTAASGLAQSVVSVAIQFKATRQFKATSTCFVLKQNTHSNA